MSGRTSSPSEPSAAPLNTPFSVWSRQDRTHDVPEWVVEPKQLGWPEGTIAEAPNEDYDEDEDDDEEQEEKTTLTAKEHKIVCIRVAGGKRGNALIPRSNLVSPRHVNLPPTSLPVVASAFTCFAGILTWTATRAQRYVISCRSRRRRSNRPLREHVRVSRGEQSSI